MAAFDTERLRLSNRRLEIGRDPCCFFHVDDFLPGALYDSLAASFPGNASDYTPNEEGKRGLRSSEDPAAFEGFCAAQPAWRDLVTFLASDAFVLDVRQVLGSALAASRGVAGRKRWRNDSGRSVSNNPLRYAFFEPVRATFQLSQLPPGAAAVPHTDAPRKLVSLLLYFADADWQPAWGGATEFFAPGRGLGATAPTERVPFERLDAAAAVPFVPNRLVGFVRSPASWHGVRPLRCPPGRTRNALLINLKRVKWSKRHIP